MTAIPAAALLPVEDPAATPTPLPRAVFLDIDGPVIPAAAFFLDKNASYGRVFSPTCVAAVAKLLERADAKLVTNSTHNPHVNERTGLDLRGDLLAAGIPEARFHPDWRTAYPSPPFGRPMTRMEAVLGWLEKNGPHDWVAFDDVAFTKNKRLIVVDGDLGVGVKEYNAAAERFGLNKVRWAM